MFSGIIEELGQVKRISRRGNIVSLEVRANKVLDDVGVGDSVAVNGACLTLTRLDSGGSIVFEIIPETFHATNLGVLRISDKVNLERSLKVGGRISGHFVSGHIDCVGVIRKKACLKGNLSFEISVPQPFMRYILPKGSVAVDGVSLTVMQKKNNCLFTYVIPHTLKNTTLGFKGPSDKVNLEFDLLAKKSGYYVNTLGGA